MRVLLVEDDLITRRVVSTVMEDVGCRYTTAENGREAVELCRNNEFDICIMDCNMPVMDGFEATASIRLLEIERKSHMVIIALTGYESPEYKAKCSAAGMDEFLAKPIRLNDLRQILEKCYAQNI
jgi:CheY-like chemotaxis protein